MAGGEFAEGKITRAHTDEAERWMADGCGHATNLTVFSFDEFEGEPRVGDIFPDADGRNPRGDGRGGLKQAGATRERAIGVEGDAAMGEVSESVGGGLAFDLGPVFAAVGVLGIEQAVVQPGLIAEQEQAFGVGIEATEGIDAAGQVEVGEGAPTRPGLGSELREDAVGFVESEKHAVAKEGSGVQG